MKFRVSELGPSYSPDPSLTFLAPPIQEGSVNLTSRSLSLVEPEKDRRRNPRNSVKGRCVFLSMKTGSVKFLRLSSVHKIVSGLSEVDRGFMFCEPLFLGIRKLREG